MADKTTKTLQWVALVATLVIAIASPIVAVTKVNTSNEYIADAAKEAKDIAASNRVKIQENAEDLEYFKGKIEGTLDGVQKSMANMADNQRDASARYDKRVDKVETKIDELLQIMVRFKRAGDDGE